MILRDHCASPDHPVSEKFYVKKKEPWGFLGRVQI